MPLWLWSSVVELASIHGRLPTALESAPSRKTLCLPRASFSGSSTAAGKDRTDAKVRDSLSRTWLKKPPH
jgi:hypothetical protein